jgi:hypothetical protein
MRRQTESRRRAFAEAEVAPLLTAAILASLLVACDPGPKPSHTVPSSTSSTISPMPATNTPAGLMALHPAKVAQSVFGFSDRVLTTAMANAGVRFQTARTPVAGVLEESWSPSWLRRAPYAEPLVYPVRTEPPPVLFHQFRQAPSWPPQPADYADPSALHLFLERARSRRVDTY